MIECHTLYGDTIQVPVDRLTFRPSAYAVIPHDGNVLLLRMQHGGKYCLPGGGIELGECINEGLKREVREEAGIEIEVQEFKHFREDFFYYDPLDAAFHSFMFFYVCKPITTELIPDDQVNDGEAAMPRWVDICTLVAGDFYNDGGIIMNILSSKNRNL